MKKVYNKAIRDKILEIIEATGNRCLIKKLGNTEFLVELEKIFSANARAARVMAYMLHWILYNSIRALSRPVIPSRVIFSV